MKKIMKKIMDKFASSPTLRLFVILMISVAFMTIIS